MKKKFRDITVNGIQYAWQASYSDDDVCWLKIWKDKKLIFDNDLSEKATPGFVSDIIKGFLIKE